MINSIVRLAAASTLLTLSAGSQASEERRLSTEYQHIVLSKVAGGLEHPWSLAFLPDGDMLVTERSGRLKRIDGEGKATLIAGAPEVVARGQGGLMDVLPHHDFANNQLVYLTYSKGHEDGINTATALARGRLKGDQLHELEDIFIQDRYSSPGRHYGSRLAWMADGSLLMSIGDRGAEPPRAQDLGDHAGKLLRLSEDGKPAQGNPYADTEGALAEIYTVGNRNIQGLIVHPETGEIWATEHGPRGGDELNLLEAGNNYGWPVVSRGRNYRTEQPYFDSTRRTHPDMVEPVIDWTPSLAASGLAVLPGDSHFQRWQGNLLAGGLRSEQVRRVVFDGGEPVHEEELIRGEIGRIRDVRIGPDGNIYVINDEPDAGIYRIAPAN